MTISISTTALIIYTAIGVGLGLLALLVDWDRWEGKKPPKE